MKKAYFLLIAILIISGIMMANITTPKDSINVNVKVLKHIEINTVPKEVKKWLKGNGGLIKTDSLDPSMRDDYYYITNTLTFSAKANCNSEIKTYFKVNNDVVSDDFYDKSKIGEIATDKYKNISGLVACITKSVDIPVETPLVISNNEANPGYTILNNKYSENQEFELEYHIVIKFDQDNWYKIKAGTDMNLGELIIIVQAKE